MHDFRPLGLSLLAALVVTLPARADEPPKVTNSIGMKLAKIPAGEFSMGSAEADGDARADEQPRHRVRITRPFYLGVYEVTQGEFAHVMGRDESFFSNDGPGKAKVAGHDTAHFPAEEVTWHKAAEFCRRLSSLPAERKARRVYRLPSEAEWEYACRGGTKTAFHFGDSLSARQANFNGKHPHGDGAAGPFLARTIKVGSYQPNAFGLHDMHGNVWEWCSDWYAADYYKRSPSDDPPGPANGTSRVIRGGGWYSDARDCRSAFRYAELPDGVFYVMGFRVAMTISDGTPPPAKAESKPDDSGKPTESPVAKADPSPRKLSANQLGEDWPRWRGSRGDGTWRGPKLPEKWPDGGLRRLWRQPIGGGYSGVVATRGRVYVMDVKKKPKPKKPKPPARSKKKKDTSPDGTERVLCFHAETGKPLWSHEYPVHYGDLQYGNGPRASPTVFDGRVYTLGTVGHLLCFDAAKGDLLWKKDLVANAGARVPMWGLSAAPVIHEDLLIVHVGAQPDGCLIAFDRRNGQRRWSSLPDAAGYATPVIIKHGGKAQLVCWTAKNIRGVNPADGKLLWTVPYEVTYGTAIATPIFQEGIVFVSGYWEGAKAIRLPGVDGPAKVLWSDNRNLRGLMSQPLYRDGLAFLLDKRHGLTCFELKTGRKLWDDDNRMTPKGRNPQATMVWLGEENRVIVLNSDGELILARLSRDGYAEQSRTSIIGPTWAHPAYMGNRVFARSDTELVCVELPVP